MTTSLSLPQQLQAHTFEGSIQQITDRMIEDLITSLADPETLTAEEQRGIIARYSAVLEGNFIYWMTATLLSVQSEAARPILLDNLHEEVRDAHPAMLRRFAIAADAFPKDTDALAIHEELTKVRLFLARLSPVQSLLTMAFFEGFIQRFMPYLAELAAARGSAEMEYTDVHGVCDIGHTAGLFRALEEEMFVSPLDPDKDLFEGVIFLRTLILRIAYN
jgi:hypothetical protein